MLPLYIHRNSPVHRLPAGIKLAACLTGTAALAFLHSPVWLTVALLGIAGLYALARLPFAAILAALRPLLLIAALVFLLQLVLADLPQALGAALRIAALVLLASLVTVTTPLSDMIEALTRAASPFARFGLSPAKLGLAIALTIRFIPMLANHWQEVRRARQARGATGADYMAIGPLILKILSMTNVLADAIAARDFDGRR